MNNAAIDESSPIRDNNFMQIFDDIMNTNLRSVAELTHFSVKYLEITNGTIINIAAIAGVMPVRGMSLG